MLMHRDVIELAERIPEPLERGKKFLAPPRLPLAGNTWAKNSVA
jgi:hypothetical protein